MKTKFISPLNDFVVKCIYGDQKNIGNTEGFLKTVLDLPPEEYGGLTVIDPFLKRWRMIADYREKERRDARAALGYARDEGLAEGRAEGQQALVEKDQVIAEKDREIMELRRRLQDKEI
jgi:hypothetical protein